MVFDVVYFLYVLWRILRILYLYLLLVFDVLFGLKFDCGGTILIVNIP